MSETPISAHQEDLAALLEVLAGKTSQDPILATQDFLQKYPERAEGYFVLGVLTYLSGYVGDATHMIEKAHDLDPDVREYAVALASLYTVSDRVNDALYFAKLGTALESHPEMAGILPPSLKNFVEAAGATDIHNHYVSALLAFNRREFCLARDECALELKMDPSYVPALQLYASSLIELGEHGGAVPYLQKVLQLKSERGAEDHLMLADALCHLGLFDQAKAQVQEALRCEPNSIDIGVTALFLLTQMPDTDDARKDVETALAKNGLVEQTPFFEYTPPSDKKFRIGFLSDKCYDCFEGEVLSTLLKKFDKTLLESHVYIQNINKDGVTQALKNWADNAREVYDINDKTLALIMQRDHIDILVDMCGFGRGQRLSLLAHQPGGLRVNWLAPLYGGGHLPGINAVIADAAAQDACMRLLHDSQECAAFRTPMFARSPMGGYGDVVPPPVLQKGYVTFGAHLNFLALSGEEGALWTRVLAGIPDARLRIHIGTQISELSLARLNEIFEPLGLLDRVELYQPDGDERLGGFFDQVDIFLASKFDRPDDVVEALWMGVPCLTTVSAQQRQVNYIGSVIHAAGIPSWVCQTDGAFYNLARALAGDQGELSGLRQVLRGKVAKSALMDVNGFAMEFQVRMVEMFVRRVQKGDQ